jgi:hypothetical protein
MENEAGAGRDQRQNKKLAELNMLQGCESDRCVWKSVRAPRNRDARGSRAAHEAPSDPPLAGGPVRPTPRVPLCDAPPRPAAHILPPFIHFLEDKMVKKEGTRVGLNKG